MPDLMTALRNADAAGDTEAAARIARMIQAQQSQAPQEQPIPEATPREVTLGGELLGGAEGALSLASGAIAEPLAGIVGVAQSLNPFAEEGAGARAVEATREALTYQPRTESGQEAIADVAGVVEPVIEKVQEFKQYLGDDTYAATGSPLLASIATTLPEATLSLLGVRGGKPSAQQLSQQRATQAISKGTSKAQSATKQKIGQMIQEGSANADTAPFKLAQSIEKGVVKVVKDPAAQSTIKQGFDPGVIAAVKGSTKLDQSKMLKMVDIMEKVKKNALYGQKNRPADVAGDTLMERVKDIVSVNKKAGKALDVEARKLKGQRVDKSPALNQFADDLDSMGVQFDAKGKPNFKGSDIEGIPSAEKIINTMVNRLRSARTNDAYAVHQLKRFIDEHISYGKKTEGLGGKTERVLKSLRRNLDESLDVEFPDYNKVNTEYAETIGALDALKDVTGKKMDLTGPNASKATGTLLRRIMGNAQSRIPLMDAIDSIENVAQKYGKIAKGQDDILSQILFADELDNVFKPVARTSLKGDLSSVVSEIPTTMTGLAVSGGKKAIEAVRNINEEAAFKSIKELLKQKN
jgi:hypothetical protein